MRYDEYLYQIDSYATAENYISYMMEEYAFPKSRAKTAAARVFEDYKNVNLNAKEIHMISNEELMEFSLKKEHLHLTLDEADLLNGYMEGHGYRLTVINDELYRLDLCAGTEPAIELYDIYEVIDQAALWNDELQEEAYNAMQSPNDFIDFCKQKNFYDDYVQTSEKIDIILSKYKHSKFNITLNDKVDSLIASNETKKNCEDKQPPIKKGKMR